MTWKAYIDPIRLILINKAKPKIIMELFETAAGRAMDFGESATKRWYYGEKNCDSYKWFPKGEFDKENLKKIYDIFRNRPDNKLEKLQQEFRKTTDRNGPIDLETNDMDIFCWSLVNQFLDLLGFQMIDITEILPDKKTVSGNQTSDDVTVCDNQTSDDVTANNNQTSNDEDVGTEAEFITSENNEKSNINQTDSQNTFLGAQLSIPKDCKICLYCENWKGNTREALESISGAYGRCTHLGKDMLSKEFKCEGFIEKWGLITEYLFSHHDKTKY